ncbi:hypothetical protein H6P81_001042 [Aristolochia fimbriata]|uniref:Ribosomal protein L2 n=1 Tax=Aristolochia fimbriata TaxID=158543 RepID=A0AAV7F7F1_ARIFI|nr:hypothetical protein H6P81_001042 [Aristolochia fimbriata]
MYYINITTNPSCPLPQRAKTLYFHGFISFPSSPINGRPHPPRRWGQVSFSSSPHHVILSSRMAALGSTGGTRYDTPTRYFLFVFVFVLSSKYLPSRVSSFHLFTHLSTETQDSWLRSSDFGYPVPILDPFFFTAVNRSHTALTGRGRGRQNAIKIRSPKRNLRRHFHANPEGQVRARWQDKEIRELLCHRSAKGTASHVYRGKRKGYVARARLPRGDGSYGWAFICRGFSRTAGLLVKPPSPRPVLASGSFVPSKPLFPGGHVTAHPAPDVYRLSPSPLIPIRSAIKKSPPGRKWPFKVIPIP